MRRSYFAVFIAVCMCIYACTKDEFFHQEKVDTGLNISKNSTSAFAAKQQLGDIVFLYEANNKTSSSTFSTLKIYDLKVSDKAISEISFSVDTSQVAYKYIQHKKVIQIAQKLSSTIGVLDTDSLVLKYEVFGRTILAQEGVDKSSSVVQSLFYHNAVLNSINRSKKSREDCGCTPHTGYFVGKTSFFCQEDYFVNPEAGFQYLDKKKVRLTQIEQKAYSFFSQNRNLERVSIDQLTKVTMPNFIQRVEDSYNIAMYGLNARISAPASCSGCSSGLCGTDYGCCGNYEGCCWFASYVCYLHDQACMHCDAWYCGPQCHPG